MKARDTFNETWWSVEIPVGWRARADKECATFQQSPSLGAFQISSARKDSAITDLDLNEFANEHIPQGMQLMRVVYGDFSGLSGCFQKSDVVWREWWLRCGRLMVYATYNVSADRLHEAVKEQSDVESILATLKARDASL